jgi:NAD-dependent dihydropyrimidine dehydrogenase PreA subunit
MNEQDVYRRLQVHLDQMPIGFPATESGVELRILKHLFTPEQAEVALHLSAIPEPLEKIHGRMKGNGLELDDLRKSLNRLASKGSIYKTRRDGKPHYSKVMLAVGMFEFQVNRLTRQFHEDMMEYMEGEFGKAFHTKRTSQLRTIPIKEEVIPERAVGTYDGARELVQNSEGPFGVLPCVCRQGMDLMDEPCQQTEIRETCLVMGSFAKSTIRTRTAKELTREEVLGILERADDVGMVLQPQNTQDPHYICCCCGCCCGVLTSVKKLPKPAEYFDTNFVAVVDEELCTECGDCADRCQMEAIEYVDGVAAIVETRCIGCALCITTCPSEALQLVQKAETKVPPETEMELYKKIALERFGPVAGAKLLGKKMLGMKI